MTDRMAKIRNSVKRQLSAAIEDVLANDEEIWKEAVDPIVQNELDDCRPFFSVGDDGKLTVFVAWGIPGEVFANLDIIAELNEIREDGDDAQMIMAIDELAQKLAELRCKAEQRMQEEVT